MIDWNKIHWEENYYNKEIENLILQHHGYKLESRLFRQKVGNKEVDVILIVKTKEKEIKRAIGIELKENDIVKAVSQAIERREYFHHFYVVINLEISSIVKWIFLDSNLYLAIKGYGIGLISAYEKRMVLPSKFYNVYKLCDYIF